MTAAFLLGDIPVSSSAGRELLYRNQELLINFDQGIPRNVEVLVPSMQRLINSKLSAENQKAFVEMVVALSLKDRASLGFVTTTLLAVSNRVPIVNNAYRLLWAINPSAQRCTTCGALDQEETRCT